MVFSDRADAGIRLASVLRQVGLRDPLVVGLPRGGVVTAAAVAARLEAPLDIIVAKKITHPWSPEYAIGAIAETGLPIWSEEGLRSSSAAWRARTATDVQRLAREAHLTYLDLPEPSHWEGRAIILVDDGAATGLTMTAAVAVARRLRATSITVAVPVAPHGRLEGLASRLVVLLEPSSGFGSVGQYYVDFKPVTDATVRELLQNSRRPGPVREPLDLESLNDVLAQVDHFPTSSSLLANIARNVPATPGIAEFFEALPAEAKFQNKEEVISQALLIYQLLESERQEPRDNSFPGD